MNLGICGDGQLAKMLIERKPKADQIYFSSTSKNSSAGSVSNNKINTIADLVKAVDLLTYESEFIDLSQLSGAEVKPNLSAMALGQNKLRQKIMFLDLGLPTSKFVSMDDGDDTKLFLQTCDVVFDSTYMIKKSFGGYDGKGNLLMYPESSRDKARAFIADRSAYAEEKIKFKRELARSFARNAKGEFVALPLVISEQTQGICNWVYGPAKDFAVAQKWDDLSFQCGKSIAEHLDYHGVFAIEFFETETDLLINEMAPRVHNSAHYSLLFETSQFDLHWHAIKNMPLAFATDSLFVSKNLLGPNDLQKSLQQNLNLPIEQGMQLNWYNKTEVRPLRKMGHINARLNKVEDIEDIKAKILKYEEQIWQTVQK